MTEPKDFEIVGSYNNQRNTTMDDERTVNLFEYNDPLGKKPKALYPTSGIVNTNLNFTPETGPSRGTFVFNNVIYQVFGGSIFAISGNGPDSLTISKIGSLTTSQGYVGIDANTFQILFVDHEFGYIYDTNTTLFKQITDDSFPDLPIDCCYLDGFFVVINGGTNQFELSSFDQGLVWGIGFTQAPATPTSTPVYTYTADTVNNWLILSTTVNYQTGTPFFVQNSGGASPAPLVASVDAATATYYYAINVDATHIRVAASAANAKANVPIVLTTNGSGTNTLNNNGQLQEGQVTSHPGTLVACRTLHRKIFFFSQNFTEVWENKGAGANLPFRRNNTLLMEVGTPAQNSIATGFDMMFFLSQDKDGLGTIMQVDGSQARPISTRALDFQLAQYAQEQINGISFISDATGDVVKENGLIFYRLNFTLANHTFVYCHTLSSEGDYQWHEEEQLDCTRFPAQTHCYYNGINYYGDYLTSKFYYVDSNVSTIDGTAVKRMRIGRTFAPPGYNRLRIDRFQLDLRQGMVGTIPGDLISIDTENGVALTTENGNTLIVGQQSDIQGPQPIVYLSYSKDGGQTYGYRQPAFMGNIGEYSARTVWRKLGTVPRGQGFTPKIEFFNETPFIILGASWNVEVMPE